MTWPAHGSFNQVSSQLCLAGLSWLESAHILVRVDFDWGSFRVKVIWENRLVEENDSGILAADGAVVKLSLIRHIKFSVLFCFTFCFLSSPIHLNFCRPILNTPSWRFYCNILARLYFVFNIFCSSIGPIKLITKYYFYHDSIIFVTVWHLG